MPPKRERQVDRGHPHPVIDDLDQALTRGFDAHLDLGRAAIDRVFHQLLDDRRGSIDHFPGGDTVGDRR